METAGENQSVLLDMGLDTFVMPSFEGSLRRVAGVVNEAAAALPPLTAE